MCGWTKDNHNLREAILNSLNADIITICETHLRDQEVIDINGYSWYGHNRTDIHRNAPKGSGGVGIFIKQCLFNCYNIEVIDKSFEGILTLRLTNRNIKGELIVFSCYLPPENSVL